MATSILNWQRAAGAILDNLTREEIRFARTVETGTAHLENLLSELRASGQTTLDGRRAFDLYATYGLPFEISRDIAREHGLDVDEEGFKAAMKSIALLRAAVKPWASLAAKMPNSSRAF